MSKHKPPRQVQKAASQALRWIEAGKAGKGFTSTGEHRADQLAKGQEVDDDVIEKMSAYFARHGKDAEAKGFHSGEDGFPSPGRVAWDAWGGDPGKKWAEAETKHNGEDRGTGRS